MRYEKGMKPVFELLDQIIERAKKTKDQHEKEQLMGAVKIMIDQLKENQRVTRQL